MALNDIVDIESYRSETKDILSRADRGPSDRIRALEKLRELTDSGDVNVSDFLEAGDIAGKEFSKDFKNLAGGNADAQTMAGNLHQDFIRSTGFNMEDPRKGVVEVDATMFGDDFQERFRQELIPENITGEEREELLKGIPLDIDVNSDRFKSEREGIRQRGMMEEDIRSADEERKGRITELADLLRTQDEATFGRYIPQIAESAQAAGQLDSSAFGNELTRQRTSMEQQRQTALGLQSLQDREMALQGLLMAGDTQRGFQTAGLQREFGLNDAEANFARQMQMAQLMQPQQQGGGKSGVQKVSQGLTVANQGLDMFKGWA